jgi:hypothetical protein
VNKRSDRPVTLKDVGKAKIIFDLHMKLKTKCAGTTQEMKAEAAQGLPSLRANLSDGLALTKREPAFGPARENCSSQRQLNESGTVV